MTHRWKTVTAVIVLAALLLSGCNYSNVAQGDQLATLAASTVEAALQLTQLAATLQQPTQTPPVLPTETFTPEPTIQVDTPTPAPPTAPPPSVTPSKPCNAAQFVSDVNYPDNTAVGLGEDFTKTWRLKNVGTCSWTSGYKLVFDGGDRMDAPSSTSFTSGSIDPGETVDISVDLTAPDDSGTYQGNFRLKDPDGVLFGIGAGASGVFWVKIKAASDEDLLPDLSVSQIRVDPSTPTEEEEFEVRVTVANNGGEVAEDFDVEWWSSTGAASPACDWHVDDLDPGDTGHLYCDYTYQSNYASITIKAEVDVNDDVDESDEDNNVRTKTISVTDID